MIRTFAFLCVFFMLFSAKCALLSLAVLLIPGPRVSAWLVTHLHQPRTQLPARPLAEAACPEKTRTISLLLFN